MNAQAMTAAAMDVSDADIVRIEPGGVAPLVELHVTLQRAFRRLAVRGQPPRILLDLRGTRVEAESSEVPLFIDFLRRGALSALRAGPGTLVLLTGEASPTSPLGSVLTAIANLPEFRGEIVIATTFETACQALS